MGGRFQIPILLGSALLIAACNQSVNSGGAPNASQSLINMGLLVTPQTSNLSAYQTETLYVTDGHPPYHFVIAGGPGSVDYNTGVFSANAMSGTTTVQITDAAGEVAQATITITGTSTPTGSTTPTVTGTNCAAMVNQPDVAFEDSSSTGVGYAMAYTSIQDPYSCASWCGQESAGYCEWSPNGGSAVCVAWAPGTALTEYTSSWTTYSSACQD